MVLVKIFKIRCQRCGHEWTPKKADVRQCPKCKTAYWDIKKENENESQVTTTEDK